MNFLGGSHEQMAREVQQFTAFKQQCLLEGKKEPKGDGAIIFDEVKVISKLMWNSRSEKIVGFAMTSEEMHSLHDAYQILNQDGRNQTNYVLQFLWRDLTSSFDVVGPYYTSTGSLESKFILSCVFQTVRLFHLYGFHTSILVCDGASCNISALKSTCGVSGAYGISASSTDRHAIKPWFSNPFNPKVNIYWIICPSHQVSAYIQIYAILHFISL